MFELLKLDKTEPNYQDLFKFIAIVSMIIDHYGIFIHYESWIRLIGRIAMPFFCFFAGYNYYRVRSEKNISFFYKIPRYKKLMFLGIILQFYTIILIPELTLLNIILSIVISLFLIDLFEKYKISYVFFHALLICSIPFSYIIYDYGTIGTGFVFLGYLARGQRGIIYKNFAAIWSVILLVSSSRKFSEIEILLLVCICLAFFYIFSFVNLEKKLPFRSVLISRYALEIYSIQYVFFTLVFYINSHF